MYDLQQSDQILCDFRKFLGLKSIIAWEIIAKCVIQMSKYPLHWSFDNFYVISQKGVSGLADKGPHKAQSEMFLTMLIRNGLDISAKARTEYIGNAIVRWFKKWEMESEIPIKKLREKHEYWMRTPIQLFLDVEDTESIRLLIENGADPNEVQFNGWRLIHLASGEGQAETTKMLIEKGAEVNSIDSYGRNPLHFVPGHHIQTAQTLIEAGVNVNAKDKNHRTPLHSASLKGHTEMAKLLIKNKADLSLLDKDNRTPYILACFYGLQKTVLISMLWIELDGMALNGLLIWIIV